MTDPRLQLVSDKAYHVATPPVTDNARRRLPVADPTLGEGGMVLVGGGREIDEGKRREKRRSGGKKEKGREEKKRQERWDEKRGRGEKGEREKKER